MKKMGAIFGALLLGLLVVAATYAYWSQTLSISGTVSTGYLQAKIVNVTTYDNEVTYDVGTITATIGANGTSATITISNAYPGYNATAVFTIKNTGSIPVKLSDVVNNNNTEINVTTTWSGLDANGVLLPNSTATLTVLTSVTDLAAQNSTYTYNITINVAQFNAP